MRIFTENRLIQGLSVIGLMSGTSMDGIDCAQVKIHRDRSGRDHVEFLHFFYKPYQPEIRQELLLLAAGEEGGTRRIGLMNTLLGQLYADTVSEFISSLPPEERAIDLIGSHGQTLYHSLETETYLGHDVRTSLQLGDPSHLAERFGCAVISDFRVRDQAAGGLGAPLVPFTEKKLYGDPRHDIVYLNIGGISNITYSPADSDEVIGFDTGPGNMLLDQAMEIFTDGAETYDQDGRFAARGAFHEELLAKWMQNPYYRKNPPKNSGRENFGPQVLQGMLEESRALGLTDSDTMATLTRLTARVNAQAIRDFCLRLPQRLIVSGGGSRNRQLLEDLRQEIPDCEVVTGDGVLGYPNDAKEAVAFAFLAYKTALGEPNTLPGATGAKHPVVMGKLTQ